MALEYVSSKTDSVTVVTLTGTIVAGEAVELLQRKTHELLAAGETKIILDLAGIKFADSTGIGELIDLLAAASRKGGSLKLLNLTKRIHDVLQITRLSTVFEIYDDRQKAIASFASGSEEAPAPVALPAPTTETAEAEGKRPEKAFLEDHDQEGPANRRRERRWNIPVPVRLKGTGPDGSEFEEETVTTDVSPTGMGLLLTVALQTGEQVFVVAPEEKFESAATVLEVKPLGPHMNRLRVHFPRQKRFSRAAAEKKYIYDFSTETWVAYITEGTYYDSKHQPFGKVENERIVSLDSGETIFRVRGDRLFDLRMNCIGHIL